MRLSDQALRKLSMHRCQNWTGTSLARRTEKVIQGCTCLSPFCAPIDVVLLLLQGIGERDIILCWPMSVREHPEKHHEHFTWYRKSSYLVAKLICPAVGTALVVEASPHFKSPFCLEVVWQAWWWPVELRFIITTAASKSKCVPGPSRAKRMATCWSGN